MQNMFHDPKNIIPLTQFAQEGASSIRERLQTEEPLILLQDVRPVAVVLSPEEYQRLGELAAENELLREANRRMAGDDGLPAFLKDHSTREQCCP